MALKGMEGEDLVQHLRQLFISFDPHIRESGTVDQTEETLAHLEESDENFHRYEFVKQLKKKIDEILGPQIEEEIEKQTNAGHEENGQETLVSKITDRIIHSRPYNDLTRKLKKNVKEAIDELVHNFDAEFGVGQHNSGFFTSRPDFGRNFLGSDEEESSCDSSYNHDMFLTSEYLQQLSEKLSRTRDTVMRAEALSDLNHIQTNDVISSDYFPAIRKHLLDIMNDPDEHLQSLSMKFITRGFTNTTPHTKEIYMLLADHLIGQFQSRNSMIPKIKNGIDLGRRDMIQLMKAFRLMNEFQQETINYWIRYPEMYLEDILGATLKLYSINHVGPVGTSQQCSPLHLVALLDTKAQWFIKWMHGNFSRSFLLILLEKHKPFVENAVKHCLEFSAARKVPFDTMSEMSEPVSRTRTSYGPSSYDGKRTKLTGAELEYAYFVQSACVIGKLLCFANGRKFFPIHLKDTEDPVSIKKLMVAMVLVVVDPSVAFHSKKSSHDQYDPAKLVAEILKGLCSSEQGCEMCLFKDEITSTLLSPVSHFLDLAEHQTPSEKTLLHVADILSMVASSTKGRRHLIYGEKKDVFTRTKSSAAHIIAEFTKKALRRQLPREAGRPPTNAVIGAYLYICRQLYNTCEGLLVLYPYELHNVVAEAWREASRDAHSSHTPTPVVADDDSSSDNSSGTICDSYDSGQWEDTLQDNLLNFASTAKGILLLQQTGALNECMSYMYTRYEKKLQVSKCEKFGYGYMVTQVAATSPGMFALQKTGYIKALIAELWDVLECGPFDVTLFTPKSWPVDTVERAAHKHLIRLLNVLSAFPAVYEVLHECPLPAKSSYSYREMPQTMAGLLDRIVILDSPAKIHSLFNVEQSHGFGLRMLSTMISCLDTFLLLHSQYKVQDILLTAQAENQISKDSKEIIVDILSVERNNILVRSYLIGGPTERVLPSRTKDHDKENPYPYPLFSSFPVPREYSHMTGGRSAMKTAFLYQTHIEAEESELSKYLDNKKPDKGRIWQEKCRGLLPKILSSKPEQVKGNVIQKLLEQSTIAMNCIVEEDIFPLIQFTGTDSAVRSVTLTPLQEAGIKMAVRYGVQLKVFTNASEASEKLSLLLRKVSLFLQQQQKTVESDLRYQQSSYPGFDWFVATIFMIFSGNSERSWEVLQNLSTLAASGYLWPPRLHSSVHLPSPLSSSGIPPLFSSTGHNIEFVLQIELPLVSSAFKMSGYTPARITLHWLKQCFWNYLDWLDINHYIITCIVMGIDYQVYLCVAIFKHLQKQIMTHLQTQDLIIFLKEEPLHGFHVAQNLKYMQTLEEKYRKMILPDMLNITKP